MIELYDVRGTEIYSSTFLLLLPLHLVLPDLEYSSLPPVEDSIISLVQQYRYHFDSRTFFSSFLPYPVQNHSRLQQFSRSSDPSWQQHHRQRVDVSCAMTLLPSAPHFRPSLSPFSLWAASYESCHDIYPSSGGWGWASCPVPSTSEAHRHSSICSHSCLILMSSPGIDHGPRIELVPLLM